MVGDLPDYGLIETGRIFVVRYPRMDALQESGWQELRKEVKLSSYAKIGAGFTQGGYVVATSPTVGSSRFSHCLRSLLDINDNMSRCAASAAPTTSVTQRLPGIGTYCMTHEFRRIQGSIISLSQHTELLNSVRDDISEYKECSCYGRELPFISQIDDVISQAQATSTALGSQRTLFGDLQGNVKLLGDKFSYIRGLLGSIRSKRSRDAFYRVIVGRGSLITDVKEL
ncbi:Golgi SNAP receptor complex member 1-2-like [Primulina tabacum]|uniref:Golgi SNAP receptor complex member 1-2-like n=1 Tax=Primulina tabacum TaxID=48773 RepID=UPI003F5A195C